MQESSRKLAELLDVNRKDLRLRIGSDNEPGEAVVVPLLVFRLLADILSAMARGQFGGYHPSSRRTDNSAGRRAIERLPAVPDRSLGEGTDPASQGRYPPPGAVPGRDGLQAKHRCRANESTQRTVGSRPGTRPGLLSVQQL